MAAKRKSNKKRKTRKRTPHITYAPKKRSRFWENIGSGCMVTRRKGKRDPYPCDVQFMRGCETFLVHVPHKLYQRVGAIKKVTGPGHFKKIRGVKVDRPHCTG